MSLAATFPPAMLRNAKELKNYTLRASDGDIGRVKDFHFDAKTWEIRYLVVETGAWLASRQVLISPEAVSEPVWGEQMFPVNLTKAQVRDSPPVESARPISRQYEARLRQHFGWPVYWGALVPPLPEAAAAATGLPADPAPEEGVPHLHSTGALSGCHLHAHDGTIGHVSDFLIEEETWTVSYLVVDTHNWLPGRHVVIAPDWVTRIDWVTGRIDVSLDREAVKHSPHYEPARAMTTEYAEELRRHYGRHLPGVRHTGHSFR